MMQAVFESSIKISYKPFTWVALVDGYYLLALKCKCTGPEWGTGRWTLPMLSNIKGPVYLDKAVGKMFQLTFLKHNNQNLIGLLFSPESEKNSVRKIHFNEEVESRSLNVIHEWLDNKTKTKH